MRKCVVEVKLWVKQVRPSGRSGEYEMTLEEAKELGKKLVGQGVSPQDIKISVRDT
ncbi:hypothetical protein ES703_09297 [subsurface metagenome]